MRTFQIITFVLGLLSAGTAMAADECVRTLQTIFNEAGFNAGKPDGLPGRNTYAAGAAYREANADIILPVLTKTTTRQWCATLVPVVPSLVLIVTEGDGVSDPMKVMISEGALTAEGLAFESFGVTPRQETTIFASTDAVWLTTNYLDANDLDPRYRSGKLKSFGACNPAASFGWYSVFLCTDSEDWGRGPSPVQRIVGHELWHVIQADLVGPKAKGCCTNNDEMSVFGPEWLKEGSAQWFGLRTIAELGKINLEREVRSYLRDVPADLVVFERNSRKGFRDNRRSLSVGILATHFLVAQAGEYALPDFYRQLGRGSSWKVAFETAFGYSPEQFEVDFTRYVGTLR